jgi:hypothetical protein
MSSFVGMPVSVSVAVVTKVPVHVWRMIIASVGNTRGRIKPILMLLTVGVFGILTIIDIIMIATNSFTDKNGRLVSSKA